MTFTEMITLYPEKAEQATERLAIMVIEGMDERQAQKKIVDLYKIRYHLFEQRDLFDKLCDQ